MATEAERCSASDRFLIMQPNPEESWWRMWGGLDGYAGAMVDKVLTEAADQLPSLPDGSRGGMSWRRATALVESLVSDDPMPAHITLFVETARAAPSNGETGVTIDAGPNVGPATLQAVLCESIIEVTARDEGGRFMDYGRKHRTAPPALKRALIARAGSRCEADGCQSRHRLQIHHLIPWSRGGPPTRTTWLSCAGSTIRSWSTNVASRSISTKAGASAFAIQNGARLGRYHPPSPTSTTV